MVVGLLRPADEQAAEAIEPGVRALDDPAAGAEACLPLERLLLFTAGADVRAEPVLADEFVDLRIVVPLVQADPLRLSGGDVRVGRPCRRTGASVSPFFALSVGLGPVSAPPRGALP